MPFHLIDSKRWHHLQRCLPHFLCRSRIDFLFQTRSGQRVANLGSPHGHAREYSLFNHLFLWHPFFAHFSFDMRFPNHQDLNHSRVNRYSCISPPYLLQSASLKAWILTAILLQSHPDLARSLAE